MSYNKEIKHIKGCDYMKMGIVVHAPVSYKSANPYKSL